DTTLVSNLSVLLDKCDLEDILKYAGPCAQLAETNAAAASDPALKKFYLEHLASSVNNMGVYANQHSDIPAALACFNRALKIQEELKDKAGVAAALNNIGVIYEYQGSI